MAAKLGCTPQTLHNLLRSAQVENDPREGLTVNKRNRPKALGRENRELRKASAYFAQAQHDRRSEP